MSEEFFTEANEGNEEQSSNPETFAMFLPTSFPSLASVQILSLVAAGRLVTLREKIQI